MSKSRLWTRDFVLDCFICFVANLAYYMTMVIVTDYAITQFSATLSEAGFTCGVFILGALFARLFIGHAIEKIGMKRSLYIGMVTFLLGTLLNFAANNLWLLSAVRFVQGIGFGIASTATGTIMAQLVPSARRGEGTSYYAKFVTTATAIGPFAGIYLYQGGSLLFNLVLSSLLLLLGLAATWQLTVKELPCAAEPFHYEFSPSNLLEPKALPIAIITFFVSLGFAGILGFITSFEKEIGLLDSGRYFFVIYAVSTVLSRPFTGRLFDRKGDNFVMYPSFVIFGFGLIVLSHTTDGLMLAFVAICLGLGFGTYMSCAQAIAIKVSPKESMGRATSTFFVFMDLVWDSARCFWGCSCRQSVLADSTCLWD